MKKILFIVFCTMFCCFGVNAQNDEIVPTIDEELSVNDTIDQEQNFESQTSGVQTKSTVSPQLQEVTALIAQLKQLTLHGPEQKEEPEITDICVPIRGKSKFVRRHHIYQTLDISPTVSSDNDPNLPEKTSNGKDVDEDQIESPVGFGLNFGYSLIFVPGREDNQNGMLRLNPMGFAYNVGLVASFSRQDTYGTTCNLLLKTGIETGNGHAMGIGVDFLGGYGKSTGDSYLVILSSEDDEDDLTSPYTAWCWQYGMQLWLRTNLLKTAVKNAEMLIFARMIRSVNPNGDLYFVNDNVYADNYWKDESWSFGVTLRYKF